MVARHHPTLEWEQDWNGSGQFDHPAFDLSKYVLSARVTGGNSLSQYAGGIQFASSRGQVLLDNKSGRFDFIGGAIQARDMTRARLCRYKINGEVAWAGRAILDIEGLAEDNTVARLKLSSRASIILSESNDYVDNVGEELLTTKLTRFANKSGPQVYTGDPQFIAFDFGPESPGAYGNGRLVGPILYSGSWPELLDHAGNLMGGWFVERPNGRLYYADLEETAISFAVDHSFSIADYEQDVTLKGGALPNTVFNTAKYSGLRLTAQTNEQGTVTAEVIAEQQFEVEAGVPFEAFAEFTPTQDVRWIRWALEPVSVDKPIISTEGAVVLPDGVKIIITPAETGTYTIRFYGIPIYAVQAYNFIEKSTSDIDYRNSVVGHGSRELVLPDWQTSHFSNDQIDAQRRFLRRLYEPMRLVVAKWSANQVTRELSDRLRDYAIPGNVIGLDDTRVLVMSYSLSQEGNLGEREIRGIRLDGLPEIPSVLPPLRRPGDAVSTIVDTETGNPNLDDALDVPPGEAACGIMNDLIDLRWPYVEPSGLWHDGSAAGSSTPPEYREEIDSGSSTYYALSTGHQMLTIRQSIPATPGGVDVIVTWEGLPFPTSAEAIAYADAVTVTVVLHSGDPIVLDIDRSAVVPTQWVVIQSTHGIDPLPHSNLLGVQVVPSYAQWRAAQ